MIRIGNCEHTHLPIVQVKRENVFSLKWKKHEWTCRHDSHSRMKDLKEIIRYLTKGYKQISSGKYKVMITITILQVTGDVTVEKKLYIKYMDSVYANKDLFLLITVGYKAVLTEYRAIITDDKA
jgi:hypothetical protein